MVLTVLESVESGSDEDPGSYTADIVHLKSDSQKNTFKTFCTFRFLRVIV